MEKSFTKLNQHGQRYERRFGRVWSGNETISSAFGRVETAGQDVYIAGKTDPSFIGDIQIKNNAKRMQNDKICFFDEKARIYKS